MKYVFFLKKLLKIGLFLILAITAFAQGEQRLTEIRPGIKTDFYHLKMPGGTEQNSVSKIVQDSLGQMWFATKDGLIRYNGKKLYIYKNDLHNPHSIGFNFITDLLIDRDNNLWIGTEKGVYRYRYPTDDFEALAPEQLSSRYITQIQADSSNNLWIIDHHTNTLFRYDPRTGELATEIQDDLSDEKGKINLLRMYITPGGRFFLLNHRDGFIEYHPGSRDFERHDLISPSVREQYRDKLYNLFDRIIPDRHHPGTLWITTHLGYLISYHLPSGKWVKYVYNRRLTNHGFHCFSSGIFQDDKDNIWLTTWFYGTFQILPGRRQYIHYYPDPDNPQGISNSITTAVYQDKAGYMWFGNEYQGVDILKKNKKFSVYPVYPPLPGQMPPGHYLSLIKDTADRIWVGMEGGMYAVNSRTLQAENYTQILTPGAQRYFALMNDRQKNYWIGTENGVYHLDENLKPVEHLTYRKDDFNSIGENFCGALLQDSRGRIWIGSFNNGLTEYDPSRGKFYRYVPDDQDPKSISHPYISALYEDDGHTLWVGTYDGLNRLNRKSGRFSIYQYDKNNPRGIGSSVINDINGTGDSIWIATQGGGLALYDKRKKIFKNYTVAQGLPDNNVKSIETDDRGNLWLATTKNIVKFHPATGQFTVFGPSDGLENRLYVENMGWQELSFSGHFSFKDEQGYLYFGGSGGIVFFHPGRLPQNTYRAPLYIERIKVNGKPVIHNGKGLDLKPDENHLEFEFTLTNLIQPDKNSYAWQLQPYDTAWQYGGNRGKAEYFNLPPGDYRLFYKAANNDGYWSEGVAPLEVHIKARFYQTRLFFFSLGGFLLVLITGLALYRRYLDKQWELKRKKLRYSSSALSEEKAREINQKLIATLNREKWYLEPDINLHKLSDIIGVKPNYLSQVINQFHGQNFYEFINSYRIEEAKRLLVETTLKIEAVAYDSGFNSLSTFHTAFKKNVGMPPSKYRKKSNNIKPGE